MKPVVDFEANPPPTRHRVEKLQGKLPGDYLDFLRNSDGGEGFLPNGEYAALWRASELEEFNLEYQVSEYAPGLFLFGSNGGGEAYAFDLRNDERAVVRVPFVGMDIDEIEPITKRFTEFFAGGWSFD